MAAKTLLQKGLSLLLKQQTNIISAAFIIMMTVVLSQILGLVRQRLLVSIFGASNTLGIYLASTRFPDFLFQLIIAGALSSALIPVLSDYLAKDKEEHAHKIASALLLFSLIIFSIISIVVFIFAEFFAGVIAPGFNHEQTVMMANMMRIILVGELFFVVGNFLSAILQTYNHFFVPGIASALYNLGIIISLLLFSDMFGIYAAPIGMVLGAFIFVLVQIPVFKKINFKFTLSLSLQIEGGWEVLKLMWPRTLSIAIFQVGSLFTLNLISYLANPGRSYVIFDYAQTLAYAPVVLFGNTIAQASFPVLSRLKDRLPEFRATFITSLNQMLYLILPLSAIMLVLRIPVVRLVFGASEFDWEATVLTGSTLALLSLSIFAQALTTLVSRAFYALHNTKTPLIIGGISTAVMLTLAAFATFYTNFGVEGIALAYSVATILQLFALLFVLDRAVGGFDHKAIFISQTKFFFATIFTGIALYIPIKLLDQLVFDTTRTVNLIILTGISALAGGLLYLFLTWLFSVKEATTFILLFKRAGNWKEILGKTDEQLEGTKINP